MTLINTTEDEDTYLEFLHNADMLPDWIHAMLKRMDWEIESLRTELERKDD